MQTKIFLSFLRQRFPLAAVLALLLAVLQISVDALTWIQLNVSIVYSLPLVLSAVTRSRRLLWVLMWSLIAATFIVYAFQMPFAQAAVYEPYFVNRVLSAATLVVTAGFLHVWMITVDTLDTKSQQLNERNAALEAANRELMLREDRIAQQNKELDQRRRDAEEASGRKSEMLAAVSHDIRTPVHTINLLAHIIRETADDPALVTKIPDMAERLEANAGSLADLLADVLDTVRFDSGRLLVQKSSFSLNDLIAGQCRDMSALAQRKGLRLEAQRTEIPLWLWTDRVKLSRVVSNLITNAVKYTESGSITVSATSANDGAVLISVRDTGIGIDPAQLDDVFQEFSQVDDGNRQRDGWGLGLAICKRLMEALEGSISAQSEPGNGSVFIMRLPASSVIPPFNGVKAHN